MKYACIAAMTIALVTINATAHSSDTVSDYSQLTVALHAILNYGTYDPQYRECPVIYGTLEQNEFKLAAAPFKKLLQDQNIAIPVKERLVEFLCQPVAISNAQLLKKHDPITFYRLKLSDFINEKILGKDEFIFSDGMGSHEEQLYAIFDETREGALNASAFKAQIQPFKDKLFSNTWLLLHPYDSHNNRLKNIFLQERMSILDLVKKYDTELYQIVIAYKATLQTPN